MKRLNDRGFTLTEVLVTVVISSIIMLSILGFFQSFSGIYRAGVVENDQRMVLGIVKSYIRKELQLSKTISTSSGPLLNELSFTGGKVYKNGVDAFQAGFYGTNSVIVSLTGFGSHLTFVVSVVNAQGDSLSETYIMNTFNVGNNNILSPVSLVYYK